MSDENQATEPKTKIDKAEIIARAEAGEGYREIAESMKCTRAYVSLVATQAGIRRRVKKPVQAEPIEVVGGGE